MQAYGRLDDPLPRLVHLLGARATVARDYARQPADIRALLDAYAAGLNRYAEKHPGEIRLGKLVMHVYFK